MGEPIDVTAAVILRGGCILIAQRGSGHLAGKWEFPGGKFDPACDADLPACLRREVWEELEVEIEVGELFQVVPCELETGERILLHVYLCAIAEGEPVAKVHAELRWVRRGELALYFFPPADIPIVERLFRDGIPP